MKLFRQVLLCGVIWTLDLNDVSAAADVNDILTSVLSEMKSLKHDLHTTKHDLHTTQVRLMIAEREIEKLKSENQQVERAKQSIFKSEDKEYNLNISTTKNISHLGTFHTTNISPNVAVPRSMGVQSPGVHIKVAFTAYLSRTITELGRQHPIPFDLVLLNEGQAYDTILHAFTCPVGGIYVFQSALMASHSEFIETEIVKDGATIVHMYGSGSTGSHGFDQGFNSATVQCNKGSKVWVQVLGHRGTSIYAERFSTFSGYLLWSV